MSQNAIFESRICHWPYKLETASVNRTTKFAIGEIDPTRSLLFDVTKEHLFFALKIRSL